MKDKLAADHERRMKQKEEGLAQMVGLIDELVILVKQERTPEQEERRKKLAATCSSPEYRKFLRTMFPDQDWDEVERMAGIGMGDAWNSPIMKQFVQQLAQKAQSQQKW